MAYTTNKKALHEYEILSREEAGLVLSGQEVKSIRDGQMKLTGAHVTFYKGEAFLTGAHIPPYKHSSVSGEYDPTRSRKLLLHRKQIDNLQGKLAEKGLTIVPVSVYNKGRQIKIEIALAKGKKLHDKRRSIKDREAKREKSRILKSLK